MMKEASLLERMKTKNFYIIIVLITISSCTLWLLNTPSPTFQSIVTKTHKGIKNLPSNIQSNHEMTVNPLYLHRLGLGKINADASISTKSSKQEGDKVLQSQPVIASSFQKENFEEISVFMDSVIKHMPDYHLVVFDLTSSEQASTLLQKRCNNTWSCEVRKFEFDKFPSHVADLSIKSYRPICIQEMLNSYGAVIWADSAEYFLSRNVTATLEQAKSVGLVAWTIDDPTSAVTHPKMFDFFKTKKELFYFHHAIESSHIVVFNTPKVKEQIMLPWVKCALMEDCISPTGAQNVGCNYMRKPLFKYCGCHYYDMSALNVILGSVFDFDARAYAAKDVIFGNLIDDQLAARNASNPLHRSRLKLRQFVNGKATGIGH